MVSSDDFSHIPPYIPPSISSLINLQTLSIESDIKNICNLTNLKVLWLNQSGDGKISSLPNSFSNLTKLKELYIENNLFTKFPDVLFKLKLDTLGISNNKITKIPISISTLKLK
jgi:Leucine-rich repeat (LRR) protein